MVITDVYGDAIASSGDFEDFSEEYYDFLNRKVFPHERVISTLREAGVSEEDLIVFQDGEVPCDDLVKTWNKIEFNIDELVDMAMMLKLVKDYSFYSENDMIESRYRFQKLLYFINKYLKKEESYTISNSVGGELGMLDRTGYRYRFTRRDSGPYSNVAYEDKNRLYAWSLIDELVVSEDGTGEVAERNRRYGIKLTPRGEAMVKRVYDRIEESDSVIIYSWNDTQNKVVREIAGMSHDELTNMVKGDKSLLRAESGDELLVGPEKKFQTSEINFVEELTEEIAHG
ncbi:hypothetical protein C486_11484 [Natrinema gari JCM 14663]|uniref:Uncharacterized protein n=2 Tax=Natrinema gari TaxID=419186 RepID=L9YZF1_9EURY|nr:hypothetical protein C486_11484 [Natrinema gari JCM 14663]